MRKADDRVVIDMIVGDVAGKRAIILDDEIATGGSISELLDRLRDFGCTEAAVACTHGSFTGRAVERLSTHPMISQVITTDTIPAPTDWSALRVRSVADLFAEAIARIHAGTSVSSLFDGVIRPTRHPSRRSSPDVARLAVRGTAAREFAAATDRWRPVGRISPTGINRTARCVVSVSAGRRGRLVGTDEGGGNGREQQRHHDRRGLLDGSHQCP